MVLWIGQVIAWIILLAARFFLSAPAAKFGRHHSACVWSLALVSLSQLSYRVASYAPADFSDSVIHSTGYVFLI